MKKAILILLAVMLLAQSAAVLAEKRVFAYQGNVAFFEENGLMGLQDKAGNVLHKAEFVSAEPFDVNEIAQVYLADGRQGFIDEAGNYVIGPKYYEYLSNDPIFLNKITYTLDGKSGLYEPSGEVLLPAEYEAIYPCSAEANFAAKNGEMHLIDNHGKWISDLVFDSIEGFSCLGMITKNRETKYYNCKGICIYSESPTGIQYSDDNGNPVDVSAWDILEVRNQYRRGFIEGQKDKKWGVMDLQGNILIEPKWNSVSLHYPYYVMWDDDEQMYSYHIETKQISEIEFKNGNERIDLEENYIKYTNRKSQYWGYMDYAGNVLTKIHFRYGTDVWQTVSEGFTLTGNRGQWYYFDMHGNYITSKDWDFGLNFHEGLAQVQVKGKYGFINTKGELVIAAVWENVDHFSSTFGPAVAMVYKDEKPYGWINTNGELLSLYNRDK